MGVVRSRWVLVLVASAVLLASVGVAAVLWWPQPGKTEAVTPDPGPQGTVMLIPGYGGGTESLQLLRRKLQRKGISVEIVGIGNGEGDLRVYAAKVDRRARQLVRTGQPPADLIGYSAGGVIARIAASESPDLFRRVVTLATPHEGTGLADLGAAGGMCPTACQQLRPGSNLLANLPDPATRDLWLSVYSGTDDVILPPASSELSGARIVRIQDYCSGTVSHSQVPTNPQAVASVLAFLAGSPIVADCGDAGVAAG